MVQEEPEIPEEPDNPEEPENEENPSEPELPENNGVEDKVIIYRDTSSNQYYYSISTDKAVFGQIIYDLSGRQIWENSGEIEKKGIISHHLESSIYYLALYLEDGVIATSFAVY